MAKSKETFLKREKEKKKIQKRMDKEAKRQERKSHGYKGASLQDMMVHVDENGNLSDVPPVQAPVKRPLREEAKRVTDDYKRQHLTRFENKFQR